MNIGLLDIDSHNFPNLALMKIAAYHKSLGDRVEWWNGLVHYNKVYQAKVFDDTYSRDEDHVVMADEVVKGGTGYGLYNFLPDEIEHSYPDYSLYPKLTKDTAYGFLTRGCPRNCKFCIVTQKEGNQSHKVADLREFWKEQKIIKLLDPNLLACIDHESLLKQLIESKAYIDFTQGLDVRLLNKDNISLLNKVKMKEIHFAWDQMGNTAEIIKKLRLYKKLAKHKPHGFYATVYVLTNFDTTHEEDLERLYQLRELEYDPYVMVYDKANAPRETRLLQRWANNKIIFRSCKKFDDYDHLKG